MAKKKSQQERSTLGEVIEEALRAFLAPRPKSSAKNRKPQLVTYKGNGLREGVDLDSSSALLEVMDS